MALTSWKSPQSDGTIADTPASCWQYKYAIEFDYPLSLWGGFTAWADTSKWRLRLYIPPAAPWPTVGETPEQIGADIEAGTIFLHEVENRYQIVSLAGQFIMWVVAGYEHIRTTISGYRLATAKLARDITPTETTIPLTDLQGTWPPTGSGYIEWERIDYALLVDDTLTGVRRGRYTGALTHRVGAEVREAPQTIGADQGNMDPASWTDPHIITEYLSPVYKLPIPSGTRVKIDFHNVGLSQLRLSIAAIKTRVCQVAGGLAVRDAMQGVSWGIVGNGRRLASCHDDRTAGPYSARLPFAVEEGRLLRFGSSTRLAVIGSSGGTVRWADSPAEGQEGTWKTVATIATGVGFVTGCLSEDGGMLYILGRAADRGLHCYHAQLGPIGVAPSWDDLGPVTGLPTALESGCYMADQRGTLHLVTAQGTSSIAHYRSRDGGRAWQ